MNATACGRSRSSEKVEIGRVILEVEPGELADGRTGNRYQKRRYLNFVEVKGLKPRRSDAVKRKIFVRVELR